MTPVEELLGLAFLQPDKVMDSFMRIKSRSAEIRCV